MLATPSNVKVLLEIALVAKVIVLQQVPKTSSNSGLKSKYNQTNIQNQKINKTQNWFFEKIKINTLSKLTNILREMIQSNKIRDEIYL